MDAKHHKSDPMNYAVHFIWFKFFFNSYDQIQQLRRPDKLCIYLFKLWTCIVLYSYESFRCIHSYSMWMKLSKKFAGLTTKHFSHENRHIVHTQNTDIIVNSLHTFTLCTWFADEIIYLSEYFRHLLRCVKHLYTSDFWTERKSIFPFCFILVLDKSF